MSDTTSTAVETGGAETAPSTPSTPAAQEGAQSSTAPPQHHKDYDKHFEGLFGHLQEMPEKIINALREAVPPKPQTDDKPAAEDKGTQGEVVHQAEPGKPGEVSVKAEKRTFGDRWLAPKKAKS